MPVAAGELVPENNARSVLVQPPARRPPRPARRGGARVRAQLSQARLGVRPRPRDRLGRAQGQERAGRRYVLHSGGAVAERQPRRRLSRRRARRSFATTRWCSPTSRRISSRARSSRRRAASSASAAAACSCSARGRSCARGSRGTTLEDVLPLELNATRRRRRRAGVEARRAGVNRVSLTPAGEAHPVMQLAAGAGRNAEAMGSRAGAGGDRAARRAATRGQRAGRDERARRHAARAGRRAAIRRRAVDGLHRRGVVALAHAAARDRSLVRHVLEAGAALAGAARRAIRFS